MNGNGRQVNAGVVEPNHRMQQQPESQSSTLAVSPAPVPGSALDPGPGSAPTPGREMPPPHTPRWLVRIELFLRVLLRLYIGLAVCYAPWSRTFWDQNPILLRYNTIAAIATNGAVRGIISGIGLLNLWIAFHDAIRHRDG